MLHIRRRRAVKVNQVAVDAFPLQEKDLVRTTKQSSDHSSNAHPNVQESWCTASECRSTHATAGRSSTRSLLVVAQQVGWHLPRQVIVVVFITSKIIRRIASLFVLSGEYPGTNKLEQHRSPTTCHQQEHRKGEGKEPPILHNRADVVVLTISC